MKKIGLLVAILIANFSAKAQVEQTEAVKSNGGGVHINYVATKEGGSYKYEFSYYKPTFRLEPFHELDQTMVYYKNENIPSEELFVPAEDAFVVTYVRARYKGNDSIINVTHGMQYYTEDRLVFVDEFVYYLTNWKSKDDYVIKYVFKPGELTKIQGAKEVFAADKNMQKAGVTEKLENYLKTAFEKQAQLLPEWEKMNPEMVGRRERNAEYASALIEAKNNAWWASPEGQAKLKEMRESSNSNSPTKFTVVNTGSNAIDIGSQMGSHTHLQSGSSMKFNCSDDVYYYILDGTTWKKTTLIVKGKDACGRTIEL